jgi:signal transduction histidine kinase
MMRATPETAAPPLDHDAQRHAALGSFARKMAHDLNNFATVIRTYSELVMADVPITSPTHADVAEVHRAADGMVRYVQRVSRFARAGGIRLNPLSLAALLDDAVADARSNELAPVDCVLADDARGIIVRSDAVWCADVLRDLLQNAREASPSEVPVLLSGHLQQVLADEVHGSATVPRGHWAVVSVSDHGPGFAPTIDATAEEPFVSTKEGIRGAGFGLTLAMALARAQRGCLTRERIADRTVVSLWFPVTDG